MPSELEVIRQLAIQCPAVLPVTTGIGDDAAVLRNSDEGQLLVATDMLLDGIHFDSRHDSLAQIGHKALAVNLSDLAAMNAWPTAAFLSVALPRTRPDTDSHIDPLQTIVDGMQPLLDQYGIGIAGGDTNVWDGALALNVCVTGRPNRAGRIVHRSGAAPDDSLFVTGPLGGSLTDGRHLTIEPRLSLARKLCESIPVSAMLDISDGLAIDLHRLCEASSCGAIVDADRIPLHQSLRSKPHEEQIRHALSDGEDFELLFTVPQKQISPDTAARLKMLGAIEIGTITREPQVQLRRISAHIVPLEPVGWQHEIL